jgi:hypothetical protein
MGSRLQNSEREIRVILMGTQADEERLAELNRNKEQYEQRQEEQRRGEDRQLRDDVQENTRRLKLQQQRDDEERERKREVEASASRIAAGRQKYREEKAKQEAEVEASAEKIAKGREEYRNKRDTEASASRIAAGRQKYRDDQAEHNYRTNTPLKTQLLDTITGKRAANQPPKQVKPITTLGGAIAHKGKQEVNTFLAGIARPAKAINAGRDVRAKRNEKVIDPLMQLAPPKRKRSRRADSRAPIMLGTGFLFSE